ncbi:hypothetical protein BaRGS_00006946 [Batillaria attramentaria]|uniref:Cyclin-L1 n=1 Tax=Batillaria attramentaria TaxID=370345 RepID=A0ABD0LQL5_9CAEN
MADMGTTLPRDFSRVVLTLENVLIPEDKLNVTPSMLDGLDKETETDLRVLGCELIQTAGILLKLPQTAMATGQVVFQRFYYSKSFVKHNMEVLAMACINLASKIEESPRRIRDVINVFHHVKQVRNKRTIHPMVLDQNYINLKNQVIKAERRVLKELGFCVHVKHPHKIIVSYLQVLEHIDNPKLVQSSWNYMNDSLRTDVLVRYQPEAVACACIFLAARRLQVPLPSNPPWYELFRVDRLDIEAICMALLHLYARAKPNYDQLEKIVEEAKKQQVEAKQRAKSGAPSGNGTPNSGSRANSPKNVSPRPSLLPSVKKIKMEDDTRSDNGSSFSEKMNHKQKRRHDDSDASRSTRSKSRSRTSGSSRSGSGSPPPKRSRGPRSPSRHHKKDKYQDLDDRYSKDKRSHKRKRHARSRSLSRSPPRHSSSKSSSKKYYKEKRRSYTPDKSHRSRKHRNGHRDSPRDRYDKHRR